VCEKRLKNNVPLKEIQHKRFRRQKKNVRALTNKRTSLKQKGQRGSEADFSARYSFPQQLHSDRFWRDDLFHNPHEWNTLNASI